MAMGIQRDKDVSGRFSILPLERKVLMAGFTQFRSGPLPVITESGIDDCYGNWFICTF
jgi:hypothetical protein